MMLKRKTETSPSTATSCYIYCIPLSDDVIKIGGCSSLEGLTGLINRYNKYILTKDVRLGLVYPIAIDQQFEKEKALHIAMKRSGFWLEHDKFMRTGFSTFQVLADLILGNTCIILGDVIDDIDNTSKESQLKRISIKENMASFLQDHDWFVRDEEDSNHVIYVEDLMKAISRRNLKKGIEPKDLIKDGIVICLRLKRRLVTLKRHFSILV